MPFTPAPKKTFTSFKKNEWLQTPIGTHQIRILDESPFEIVTHYIKGTYVRCLGDECPVCKNNRIIFKAHPTDFKKVPGYSSKNTRYSVNVLDRTLVKICPNPECKAEVKKNGNVWPSACTCNTVLTNVKPTQLNKVKIWGWGVEQQDRLAGFYASNVDDDGTPISLTEYDFQLLVTPAANDRRSITPTPRPDLSDKVEVKSDDLFNLESAVITFTAEEIVDFMKGAQLRDIFNARRAESIEPELDKEVTDLSADVDQSIQDLFKN